jgi:transcriptional regulator with XRE-family HTH domain
MKSSRTALKQRIGDVIRRHREARNFTQEGFADHIEMHRAQYGLVEQGKRDLRVSTLERVAAGLEEPVWVILREAEGS